MQYLLIRALKNFFSMLTFSLGLMVFIYLIFFASGYLFSLPDPGIFRTDKVAVIGMIILSLSFEVGILSFFVENPIESPIFIQVVLAIIIFVILLFVKEQIFGTGWEIGL